MATTNEPNARPQTPNRPNIQRNSGFGVFVLLLLVVAMVAGGAYLAPQVSGMNEESRDSGTLTYSVQKSDILVTVVEDGNVESASNVELKCQVLGGSTILSIVEDGKVVKEGDQLVELDKSNIEDQLNSQKIQYEKALATKIQSDEDYEAAKIAVKEYEEGTFVEESKKADAEIRIAQENLRTAQNIFAYTKKMVRKGFATSLQREADEFAVERCQLDLDAAETRKKVLVDFTKEKTLKDLEAKRDASAAKMRADEAALELEKSKLERLKKQLENCIILAPRSGMVVYANDASRSRFGGQQQVQIEEGAVVRERQAIIRMPDRENMQVKVTVHESKVDQIKRRMKASIVIQENQFTGEVISIANQPEPTSWFSGNIKEYATIVAIKGENNGELRPGQTAHVEIRIAHRKDVAAIPVSSVVEQEGEYFCWLDTPEGYEKRSLKLGQTNDILVEVVDGVKVGDIVVRNPKAVIESARKKVSLETELPAKDKFGDNGADDETSAEDTDDDDSSQGQNPQSPRGSSNPGQSRSGGGGRGGYSMPQTAEEYIKRSDTNGDGKISVNDELDDRKRQYIGGNDTNDDGFIDLEEAEVALKKLKERFGGGGRPSTGRPNESAKPKEAPAENSKPEASDDNKPSPPRGGGQGSLVEKFDTDGDGKLSREEGGRLGTFFDKLDANKDGEVTEAEFQDFRKSNSGGRPGGGRPSGGPPQ
ncbi:MAG: hypothetical protein CMJ78_18015 [Planctomycetaceae bacterium]|nr:hypothetical protein [Planctomycetaceae bacterium]